MIDNSLTPNYQRHQPEQTLLYQLIERYWPEFQSHLSDVGRFLPRHVVREFEETLKCGRLEPLDSIAKLVALVPKPGTYLTRYHGVLAPNSQHRSKVTPAKRGKGSKKLGKNKEPSVEKHKEDMGTSVKAGL